jgi:diguanylate cyclase (GGDEF)-like protein
VLWLCTLFGARLGLDSGPLLAIGAAGVALTAVLLLQIQSHHTHLNDLAQTDALTALLNHRSFHERLAAGLERARLDERPLCLVVLDLDNFKTFNDAHGHPCGDDALRAVAEALSSSVRADDIAARVGGEEFALILPGADGDEGFAIAERARAAISEIRIADTRLECSAGIAAYPGDADEPAALMQLASNALYWAKRAGKRRTRRFDPDRAPADWTTNQQREVADLLASERPIVPAFQPVVSLATGRVVGYEALARFPGTPNRSPEVWFAQAHGCGLGAQLEAKAIAAAMEPLGQPLETHLAVNASPSALSSDPVRNVLAGDLTGIVVEITEHEFVADDGILADAVADLRRRGAKIAIDDAGAGHAGLRQLMRVRPDIVKLDRGLTHNIHTDPALMALVESFVRFARDVGATVCAEGIESLDELTALADLDVEWGQGWALGRPAPPWTPVDPIAAQVCQAALAQSFQSLPSIGNPVSSGDRRLVHLSALLAGARTRSDLEAALAPISAELGADDISLSRWHPDRGLIETLATTADELAEVDDFYPLAEYSLTQAVVGDQKAAQVLVSDPESDPAEVDLLLRLGERSLLIVPVVAAGECLGIIEAYRTYERPWTRTEINRARVIANQFASVIPAFIER